MRGAAGAASFSLRGLALACLVLLSLRPEEVLAPGFQMSFIAVLALLSAYSLGKDWLFGGGAMFVPKKNLMVSKSCILFFEMDSGLCIDFTDSWCCHGPCRCDAF